MCKVHLLWWCREQQGKIVALVKGNAVLSSVASVFRHRCCILATLCLQQLWPVAH